MHEVVRDVDPAHRLIQGVAAIEIAPDHLGAVSHLAGQVFRPSGQAADVLAVRLETRQQSPADITRRAGEEDARTLGRGFLE